MEKNNNLMSGKGEKGEWKTINGAHVFVEDGQSVEEAMNKTFSKGGGKSDSKAKETRQHDQYGNVLLDDKSKQIGIEAGKKYIEDMAPYHDKEKLLRSNVVPGYIIDEMTNAIHDSGYEDDVTITDIEDMMLAVTGYRFNYNVYEGRSGNFNDYFKKVDTVSPDKAKDFASGSGHLSDNGGYQGVNNAKSAPSFEYKATDGSSEWENGKYTGDQARFNKLHNALSKGHVGEPAVRRMLSELGINEAGIKNYLMTNELFNTEKNPDTCIKIVNRIFNDADYRK